MAELEIKDKSGAASGKYSLAEVLASTEISRALLHKAVVTEEANARQGTQSAKTRAEVRGGGRKPYKQKKTGRARQGSIRSPQYTHGGVVFAPKPRDYSKKMNKKEKKAALLNAIALKVQSGDMTVIENFAIEEPKTKHACNLLKTLGLLETRRVLIVLPECDEVTYKAFRNLSNVVVKTAPAIIHAENGEMTKTEAFSTRDLLVAHKIVIAKEALKRIEEVWAS